MLSHAYFPKCICLTIIIQCLQFDLSISRTMKVLNVRKEFVVPYLLSSEKTIIGARKPDMHANCESTSLLS